MKLHVRVVHRVAASKEGTDIRLITSADTGFEHEPLKPHSQHTIGAQVPVQRNRLQAPMLDVNLQVVLEIPADPRQVEANVDAEVAQMCRGTDAGEHQELR